MVLGIDKTNFEIGLQSSSLLRRKVRSAIVWGQSNRPQTYLMPPIPKDWMNQGETVK